MQFEYNKYNIMAFADNFFYNSKLVINKILLNEKPIDRNYLYYFILVLFMVQF